MPKDFSGNSFVDATAFNLGASRSDWVGRSDRNDFYQVKINQRSLSSFKLRSSGAVTISLLSSSGNTITSKSSSRQCQLDGDLDPGK